MIPNIIAFMWGLAEATIFFIVPDVGLSIISLNGVDAGIEASLFALVGALLGGTIMFYFGKANLERATQILKKIPAIPDNDVEKVQTDILKIGIRAMLFGPVFGIPYKIYAVFAHLKTTIFYFLLISIPARVIRFILITIFTPYIVEKYLPDASYLIQVKIIAISWVLFYVVYFMLKRKE